MMTAALFRPSLEQVSLLVARYPLATVVSQGDDGLHATTLPLLLERRTDGVLALLGHIAQSNPQTWTFARPCEALAVFNGPHGYVSPSWLTDRNQAPTWNFASVQMRFSLTLDETPAAARQAVDALTRHMEAGRPRSWGPEELQERYDRLLQAIVAFRGEVHDVSTKFKLGQNERQDVLNEIMTWLAGDGQQELADLMAEANADRLSVLEAGPQTQSDARWARSRTPSGQGEEG